MELDGVKLLLDGISTPCGYFLVTPPETEEMLYTADLDAMLFTHDHEDHFSCPFVEEWARRRGRYPRLAGPSDIAAQLPEGVVEEGALAVGPLAVEPVACRHMGIRYRNNLHRAYWVNGSIRCLFLGDAGPSQFLGWAGERPTVLFAPYPYITSRSGWRAVQDLGPEAVVATHLPHPGDDPEGICAQAEAFLRSAQDRPVYRPAMGEYMML